MFRDISSKQRPLMKKSGSSYRGNREVRCFIVSQWKLFSRTEVPFYYKKLIWYLIKNGWWINFSKLLKFWLREKPNFLIRIFFWFLAVNDFHNEIHWAKFASTVVRRKPYGRNKCSIESKVHLFPAYTASVTSKQMSFLDGWKISKIRLFNKTIKMFSRCKSFLSLLFSTHFHESLFRIYVLVR